MGRCRSIFYPDANLGWLISWPWAVSPSLWRAAWLPPSCVRPVVTWRGAFWWDGFWMEEPAPFLAEGPAPALRFSGTSRVPRWRAPEASWTAGAIVPCGELPPPVPCSCWALSKFQVIKGFGFWSHCDRHLAHPCWELLAGPITCHLGSQTSTAGCSCPGVQSAWRELTREGTRCIWKFVYIGS